jgi:hypothetical protein
MTQLNNRICEFYNADNTTAPHFFIIPLLAKQDLIINVITVSRDIFSTFFLKENREPTKGVLSEESKFTRQLHWGKMVKEFMD